MVRRVGEESKPRRARSKSTSTRTARQVADSDTSSVACNEGSPVKETGSGLAHAEDAGELCAEYASNCLRLGLPVDPSVYISLQTSWEILKPSGRFSEGAMQPLIGVLDGSKHVKKLNLESTTMVDARYARSGNGNSNVRALTSILQSNVHINDVNLRATGLDDDGILELCRAISHNKSITALNLAANDFGAPGARALETALQQNRTLKVLDLTNNQLGFESIRQLECSCKETGLVLMKAGNFVFEEILNAATHAIGFLLSVVGACVLMNASGELGHSTDYHFWACAVYSFSLLYLFLASACYHSSFMLPRAHDVLQILDNIGIYMLIAGTYTPLLLIGLHNSNKGINLLICEWLFAACCSMFTVYADLNHPLNNMIKLLSFIIMGGACLAIFGDLTSFLPLDCIILYALGAVAYVVGIPFFILGEDVPIYHTVWHLFVLLAATIHWFGTYQYIVGIDIHLAERIADALGSSMNSVIEDISSLKAGL